MAIQKALAVVALVAGAANADTLLHAELDPLTFANQPGYGGQIGVRHPALRGVRIAVASFALHVPDRLTDLMGNEGWDVRVRPSGAIYGLYYLREPGANGFAVGASVRYLRYHLENDHEPGSARYSEVSPEAIIAYQWHPFDNGFYVQPWLALGVTVWRSEDPITLGDPPVVYDPLPVSPFFTVNIGYEHAL